MTLHDVVDLEKHPLHEVDFTSTCASILAERGVLVLKDFIRPTTLALLQEEAQQNADKAYFCTQKHSVYLTPPDLAFPAMHPRNRQVVSSKGCICDDLVSAHSPLRTLYDAAEFRIFIMGVTGEQALHPYADSLSSINIHYAHRGQELGWHFDNSSFAITLLIQKPEVGSRFEFVKNLRDSTAGDMNYEGVGALLDGVLQPDVLSMEPGTLVLFRGRDSVHRVSPNESDTTRMLAVLAYNSEPGVSLSESARMTFYGRLT